MGTFWTAIIAAFVAAYPGSVTATYNDPNFPLDFWCAVEVSGPGVYALGWGEKADRWDPEETLEETCDAAALDMMAWWCEWHEDTANPPGHCQF
jgi:hypothetical protein